MPILAFQVPLPPHPDTRGVEQVSRYPRDYYINTLVWLRHETGVLFSTRNIKPAAPT